MGWTKHGNIFKPDGSLSWSKSHAQVPFAFKKDDDTVRIFYATRDENSCSSTTFIDVDAADPSKIIYQHDKPCINKGTPGWFDDSGTMPSWFLEHDGKIWLYYTAWNKSQSASYRLSIGLAESTDGGETFSKLYDGPILDRSIYDAIWVGQPCVRKEADGWKMWYLSCEKIEYIDGHPEPFYNVKYATSDDGINWNRTGVKCIDFDDFADAIGRPCVEFEDGVYKMYSSHRNSRGYRNDPNKSYRLAYSESSDGINWFRKDEVLEGLEFSEEGWDSIMMEYCSVYNHNGKKYLFYNGNGFGATGFGYATREL
jgi:hypothetical protein